MTMEDEEVPIYASEYGLSDRSGPGSGDVRADPAPPSEEEMERPPTYMSEYGLSARPSDQDDGDGQDPQAPREADQLEGDEAYKSESNPEFEQNFDSDE